MLDSVEKKLGHKLIPFSLIAILTLIIYSNTLNAPFDLLDDTNAIVENPAIHSPLNFHAMWNFYSNRIFLFFTFSLNYLFHGTNVTGYRITNIAIHIFCGILVFLLLYSILGLKHFENSKMYKYRNILSLISALIFVSHPIQVNGVSNIVQRAASLAALLYLMSVLFYIRYRISNKIRYLVFMSISIILAMFTKENTVTIPIMIIVTECIFFLKDDKMTWKKRGLLLSLISLSILIIPDTNLYLGGFSRTDPQGAFSATGLISRTDYFLTQLNVIVLYIWRILVPLNLNFDYSNDFPLTHSLFQYNTWLSLLFLLSLAVIAFLSLKRNKLISLGLFWFFISLSVESSIIPNQDLYLERRLYLPMFGFIIFLAGIIYFIFERGWILHFKKNLKYLLFIPVFIIIVFSVLTLSRNYIFSDGTRLWSDVVKKSPGNSRAHGILGTNYLRSYESGNINPDYLKHAEDELKKSIALGGYDRYTSHCYLVKVYFLEGKYTDCIDEANKTNGIQKSLYVYDNLGLAYQKAGKLKDAIQAFSEGYKINSCSNYILEHLADAYFEVNDLENARFYYKEYLKYYPSGNKNISEKLEIINKKLNP